MNTESEYSRVNDRITSRRRLTALLLAGIGLILLGAVGLYYYLAAQADRAAQQPTDFSAVPARVSYAAPALSLTGLDEARHSLQDYRGQVLLVNLWATWCPPCQAEMPLLQQYFEKYRGQGFTVIAVEDGEPEQEVRDFVKQYGLSFPVWLDPAHNATDRAFRTPNLPTSYVIDRAGQVRLTWVGAISSANLERYITPIIRER